MIPLPPPYPPWLPRKIKYEMPLGPVPIPSPCPRTRLLPCLQSNSNLNEVLDYLLTQWTAPLTASSNRELHRSTGDGSCQGRSHGRKLGISSPGTESCHTGEHGVSLPRNPFFPFTLSIIRALKSPTEENDPNYADVQILQ